MERNPDKGRNIATMQFVKPIVHHFRRDLRLSDNTALAAACERGSVLPVFVFDPQQADPEQNPYFSHFGFGFLIEALTSLDNELRKCGSWLRVFEGSPKSVLSRIKNDISAMYANGDVTPFARERDKRIAALGIEYKVFEDVTLTPVGSILSDAGTPYKVYSAFAKKAREVPVNYSKPAPKIIDTEGKFGAMTIDQYKTKKDWKPNANAAFRGTHAEAKERIDRISQLKNYAEERDIPSVNGTTGLSPYLKFGLVSPREAYNAAAKAHGNSCTLINELYWRDFFHHISWHFPHVFSGNFRPEFEAINWSTNEAHFTAWKEGKTGFPIVDAGMRELAKTGHMHNRVRMIVASFLVKDLHINWRHGERHFAQFLIDYDPSANNGNWQWAASTGCDAQPYFRIFNPSRQSARFDPQAEYIKKWVPELRDFTPKEIHNWAGSLLTNYQHPIVNHKAQAAAAKKMYKTAKENYANSPLSVK